MYEVLVIWQFLDGSMHAEIFGTYPTQVTCEDALAAEFYVMDDPRYSAGRIGGLGVCNRRTLSRLERENAPLRKGLW